MSNLLPNVEPNKVKDRVIAALAYRHPLTIKVLKSHIKRQYGSTVSYQAIHKVLTELSKENIVKKVNKAFMLNIEWIKRINHFSEQLLQNYSKNKKYSINVLRRLTKDGDVLTLNFNSLKELDEFFLNLIDISNSILKSEDKIIMHYTHNWWPLVYSFKEYELMRIKNRFYCLCGSNLPIDQFCCNFENKLGMNVKYSKNKTLNWHFNVFGYYVVQFYTDPKISKELYNYFENIKNIKNLDFFKLLTILNEIGAHKVVITKNIKLANQIKEQVMKLFKPKHL